jgi:hypothetical protein
VIVAVIRFKSTVIAMRYNQMTDEQGRWTLDSETEASNPGNVKVQRTTWFIAYPFWPIVWATVLFLFVILATLFHWSFWIPAAILLFINWFYWQQVTGHFAYGDANPGLVVSTNPVLIAVATDLTKGHGEFPVVKVFQKRIRLINGLPVEIGSRVATVAVYTATSDDNDPYWEDFDPRPVSCATSNQAEIQAVMNTFSKRDWENLEASIRGLPKPLLPGLHHLRAR